MTLGIACKWSKQTKTCPGFPCELSEGGWLLRVEGWIEEDVVESIAVRIRRE